MTTSYVDSQAYSEVIEDGHPILIVTASDIATVLRNNSISSYNIRDWLDSVDSDETKKRIKAYSEKLIKINEKTNST